MNINGNNEIKFWSTNHSPHFMAEEKIKRHLWGENKLHCYIFKSYAKQ